MVLRVSKYLTRKAISMSIISAFDMDKYIYAFEKLFGQLFTILYLLALGFALGSPCSMAIYLSFLIMLRGQTSGYHAKTPISCALLSGFTGGVCILISNVILRDYLFMIILALAIASFYIIINAPIAHVNLCLSLYEIVKLRRLSHIVLGAELVLTTTFYICPFTRFMSVPASLAIVTTAFFMLLSKLLKQEEEKNAKTQ